MVLLDLLTGYSLAVFETYKEAKGFAEAQQQRQVKVYYCGTPERVRPMEIAAWPKHIKGLGYMDYRYTLKDYEVRHQLKTPPPTYATAKESLENAADLLGKHLQISVGSVVIFSRW